MKPCCRIEFFPFETVISVSRHINCHHHWWRGAFIVLVHCWRLRFYAWLAMSIKFKESSRKNPNIASYINVKLKLWILNNSNVCNLRLDSVQFLLEPTFASQRKNQGFQTWFCLLSIFSTLKGDQKGIYGNTTLQQPRLERSRFLWGGQNKSQV